MDRRRGIATEVSIEELKSWLSTGDLSAPYYAPTAVAYVAASPDPDRRCRLCSYYDGGICSNAAVYADPRVPETHDGLKMVAASGWCKEFALVRVTEVERAQ